MNKEYYIPEIEDLFVGYEYERLYEDNNLLYQWEPEVVSVNFLSLEELDKEISNNEIRTPYLTKEQIEKEGWKKNGEENNYYKNSDIGLIVDTKIHNIQIYKCNAVTDWNLYLGECKSINEFRKICKWLKIE